MEFLAFSLDLMEQYLAEREVFILWHEDEAAGMFTLQYGDPDYWGSGTIRPTVTCIG